MRHLILSELRLQKYTVRPYSLIKRKTVHIFTEYQVKLWRETEAKYAGGTLKTRFQDEIQSVYIGEECIPQLKHAQFIRAA